MSLSLFYNQLTVLDYAYLDPKLGPKGDSLYVNVELIGQTTEEGVVFDFSYAKKAIKEIIDNICDHRLVVTHNSLQACTDGTYELFYSFNEKEIWYKGPEQSYCVIPFDNFSYDNLAEHLSIEVHKKMPSNVAQTIITLEQVQYPEDQATYSYTHGLKDHYGNCQRLIHGHHNPIHVYTDNKRNKELEKYLATELFNNNIHLCYWDNVVNKDEIVQIFNNEKPEGRINSAKFIHIKYKAIQGIFESKLPLSEVYIMPIESTVENIAFYFANFLSKTFNQFATIKLKAFEGLAKGSIFYLSK